MKLTTAEWVNKAEGDWEIALKATVLAKIQYMMRLAITVNNAQKNISKGDWLKLESLSPKLTIY